MRHLTEASLSRVALSLHRRCTVASGHGEIATSAPSNVQRAGRATLSAELRLATTLYRVFTRGTANQSIDNTGAGEPRYAAVLLNNWQTPGDTQPGETRDEAACDAPRSLG